MTAPSCAPLAKQFDRVARRIGTDDQKVRLGGKTLVADAGRNQHCVAHRRCRRHFALTAEPDLGLAGGNAEYFMGVGMVVVKAHSPKGNPKDETAGLFVFRLD